MTQPIDFQIVIFLRVHLNSVLVSAAMLTFLRGNGRPDVPNR